MQPILSNTRDSQQSLSEQEAILFSFDKSNYSSPRFFCNYLKKELKNDDFNMESLKLEILIYIKINNLNYQPIVFSKALKDESTRLVLSNNYFQIKVPSFIQTNSDIKEHFDELEIPFILKKLHSLPYHEVTYFQKYLNQLNNTVSLTPKKLKKEINKFLRCIKKDKFITVKIRKNIKHSSKLNRKTESGGRLQSAEILLKSTSAIDIDYISSVISTLNSALTCNNNTPENIRDIFFEHIRRTIKSSYFQQQKKQTQEEIILQELSAFFCNNNLQSLSKNLQIRFIDDILNKNLTTYDIFQESIRLIFNKKNIAIGAEIYLPSLPESPSDKEDFLISLNKKISALTNFILKAKFLPYIKENSNKFSSDITQHTSLSQLIKNIIQENSPDKAISLIYLFFHKRGIENIFICSPSKDLITNDSYGSFEKILTICDNMKLITVAHTLFIPTNIFDAYNTSIIAHEIQHALNEFFHISKIGRQNTSENINKILDITENVYYELLSFQYRNKHISTEELHDFIINLINTELDKAFQQRRLSSLLGISSTAASEWNNIQRHLRIYLYDEARATLKGGLAVSANFSGLFFYNQAMRIYQFLIKSADIIKKLEISKTGKVFSRK